MMNACTKTKVLKIANLGKTWTMIESTITGILFAVAILFFLAYAVYSAAHPRQVLSKVQLSSKHEVHGCSSTRRYRN